MAALGKIRDRAGLLITVIGVALLAFIIGDFLTNGSTFFNKTGQVVGEVDGEEFMINDFQSQVSTFNDFMKMQYGQSPSEGEARDGVWGQFVSSTIMEKEAEKIGLAVSDDELRASVYGENPSPMLRQVRFLCDENGNFSKQRLQSLIANKDEPQYAEAYKMWLYFEKMMKSQLLAMKYQKLLSTAMSPLSKFAEITSSFGKSEFDLAILKKTYYEVSDSTLNITDAEVNKKYEELKANFKTEPYRNIKVIMFDVRPSKADFDNVDYNIKITKSILDSASLDESASIIAQSSDSPTPIFYLGEKEIDPIFKEFAFSSPKGAVSDVKLDGSTYKVAKVLSDVTLIPDSVKVSRMVVFNGDKEGSQKLADSLMAELNKGANFDTLYQKFSQDQDAAKRKGGDMGWLTVGMSGSEDFDDKVFLAKTGEVVNVPIQNYCLLVKVTERTTPVRKVKLGEVINNVEPSTETYREVYSKAKSYALNHRVLKSFEDSASSYGYRVLPVTHLFRNQSEFQMIPQTRDVIKWAWNENTRVGEVSQTVFETPNSYIVAALTDVVTDKYIPLSEVKSSIENYVSNDKKAEKLMSDLEKIKDSDWSVAGKVDSVKSVKFTDRRLDKINYELSVLGSICDVAKDAVVGPIKGYSGVYLVKVTDRRDSENSVQEALRTSYGEVQHAIGKSLFQVLKDNSDIEDNRHVFY